MLQIGRGDASCLQRGSLRQIGGSIPIDSNFFFLLVQRLESFSHLALELLSYLWTVDQQRPLLKLVLVNVFLEIASCDL